MILYEPTKVFPDEDEHDLDNKKTIVEEKTVRKKKRRFIFYFLIIFITFLVVRLILIAISFYRIYSQMDFDKILLKNMKYDSENPDALWLDIQMIGGACSPLFLRIKDIECDVYGDDEKNKMRRIFSLDIPDIEIVKYKTLSFKNDISFKNCDANDIFDCRNTKKVTARIKVKLYYRFCLMLFFVSLEKEQIIKVRDENNKIRWPRIDEIAIKNVEDTLSLTFNVNHTSIHLPKYLNINLAESEIRCGRDVPCSIIFSEQNIKNGRFKSPLLVTFVVKKVDYPKIINTCLRISANDVVSYEIYEVITKKKNEIKNIIKVGFLRSWPQETKPPNQVNPNGETPQVNEKQFWKFLGPLAIIEDLKVLKNTISMNIKIDPKILSIIKKDTRLVCEGVEVHSKIRMFNRKVGDGVVYLSSVKHYININVAITLVDLKTMLDYLREGKFNFSFELGDDSKKHSLLKGLEIDYDVERWAVRYQGFKFVREFANREQSPVRKISHELFSDRDKILVKTKLPFKTETMPKGSLIVLFRIPEMDIKIEQEFFEGVLNINKTNMGYVYGGGFYGVFSTNLEIRPKREAYNHTSLFTPDIKLRIFSEDLVYNISSGRSNSEGSILQQLGLRYKDCIDLNNHTLLVKTLEVENLGKEIFEHEVSVQDGILSLGMYTKGDPLVDLKPNIRSKNTKVSFSLPYQNDRISIFSELDLYVGSLDLLRALMYGNFYFFSTKNAFSYVVGQFLNQLMSQKGIHDTKKIINKEGRFILDLNNQKENHNKYEGEVKVGIPVEVLDSFILRPFPIPRAIFNIENSEAYGYFDISSETVGEFVYIGMRFDINSEIFKTKGQELEWRVLKDENEKGGRITNPPDSILKGLRMFFIKMFEIPKDGGTGTTSSKMGLAVGHDQIEVVEVEDGESKLKTKAVAIFWAQPVEDFFLRTLPEIFLKCSFAILPKYFRCTMSSRRLYLLYCGLDHGRRSISYAKDVTSDSLFKMEYPPNIKIVHNANNYANNANSYANNANSYAHNNFFYIPEDVVKKKGKLAFRGDVFLENKFSEEMVVSKADLAFPFPFFLADVMKAPSKDPLNIFIRASSLDFAVSMPFSLNIYSKDPVKYKFYYKDYLLLEDLVLGDQGCDNFLHVSLRNLKHQSLFEMLKRISTHQDEPFCVIFTQGARRILSVSFRLDKSVYNILEYKTGKSLSGLSESLRINKKKIFSALKSFLI
ncbi:hypothetical protein NGRA_0291 [Nosema granulosis]|uniref:Uncharacterized protein n=1 Tax=Nosema granulosis TaxID=83296 RepID=A0A9P6H3W3_9MICR|nr:hypothetical protein NGRA_0291 [Nosema granulosis]